MKIYETISGNSISFGILFPDSYVMANAKAIYVTIAGRVFQHTIIDHMVRVELKSADTNMMYGEKELMITIDDDSFAVKKKSLGVIQFTKSSSTFSNQSTNTGYNFTVQLSINETAIEVTDVLYEYVKGDNGGIPEAPVNGQAYSRKDGDWVELAGGGDMLKSVYDTNGNGKVDVSEDAEKLGGKLASQYVDTTDSRLSDARPASDVSTWAKQPSKPTYTAAEVGAATITQGVKADNAEPKITYPATPTGKFYRDDKTFAEITGGGDMLKSTYDTNGNGKVDTAENAEKLGGTAAAEFVVTTDHRMSNARPASDVYAWAKAQTKPTYSASEVGAATQAQGDKADTALQVETDPVWLGDKPNYQPKVDNTLATSSKQVVGAINEVNAKVPIDPTTGSASKYFNEKGQFSEIAIDVNMLSASTVAATYALVLNQATNILNALPSGVNSTLTIPSPVSGKENESVVHFSTGATAPTIVYSGFTPVWLNGTALAMKINKTYTIVFEQVRTATSTWIVKASWGEY